MLYSSRTTTVCLHRYTLLSVQEDIYTQYSPRHSCSHKHLLSNHLFFLNWNVRWLLTSLKLSLVTVRVSLSMNFTGNVYNIAPPDCLYMYYPWQGIYLSFCSWPILLFNTNLYGHNSFPVSPRERNGLPLSLHDGSISLFTQRNKLKAETRLICFISWASKCLHLFSYTTKLGEGASGPFNPPANATDWEGTNKHFCPSLTGFKHPVAFPRTLLSILLNWLMKTPHRGEEVSFWGGRPAMAKVRYSQGPL